MKSTDHRNLLAWWHTRHELPPDQDQAAMLEAAEADAREMRLQRDVLALNWSRVRDPNVFVAMTADGDEVLGVGWSSDYVPSRCPPRLPKWYTERKAV